MGQICISYKRQVKAGRSVVFYSSYFTLRYAGTLFMYLLNFFQNWKTAVGIKVKKKSNEFYYKEELFLFSRAFKKKLVNIYTAVV